jgi:uncharacterized protein YegP (UPF0339 family)
MSGYYELKSSASGQPMFNLRAENNQVILTSQLYSSKEAALKGIASVQTHGPDPASFEKLVSGQGEPYFVLKASNSQVIGTSQMYGSEQARDIGIASVMKNSPSEKVVEAES